MKTEDFSIKFQSLQPTVQYQVCTAVAKMTIQFPENYFLFPFNWPTGNGHRFRIQYCDALNVPKYFVFFFFFVRVTRTRLNKFIYYMYQFSLRYSSSDTPMHYYWGSIIFNVSAIMYASSISKHVTDFSQLFNSRFNESFNSRHTRTWKNWFNMKCIIIEEILKTKRKKWKNIEIW